MTESLRDNTDSVTKWMATLVTMTVTRGRQCSHTCVPRRTLATFRHLSKDKHNYQHTRERVYPRFPRSPPDDAVLAAGK